MQFTDRAVQLTSSFPMQEQGLWRRHTLSSGLAIAPKNVVHACDLYVLASALIGTFLLAPVHAGAPWLIPCAET